MSTKQFEKTNRTQIIQNIKTPLTFLALVILIMEVLLVAMINKASGPNLTWLVITTCLGFLLIIIAVIILLFKSPESLLIDGDSRQLIEKIKKYEKIINDQEVIINERKKRPVNGTENMNDVNSSAEQNRKRILALVSQSNGYEIWILKNKMNIGNQYKVSEAEIETILGELIEEGKVKINPTFPNKYMRV